MGETALMKTVELEQMVGMALRLPATERAILAEKLIESLDAGEDFRVSEVWAAEARERAQAIASGMTTIPAEEVFRRKS